MAIIKSMIQLIGGGVPIQSNKYFKITTIRTATSKEIMSAMMSWFYTEV